MQVNDAMRPFLGVQTRPTRHHKTLIGCPRSTLREIPDIQALPFSGRSPRTPCMASRISCADSIARGGQAVMTFKRKVSVSSMERAPAFGHALFVPALRDGEDDEASAIANLLGFRSQ